MSSRRRDSADRRFAARAPLYADGREGLRKLSEANLDDAIVLLPSWGAPLQLPDPGVTNGVTEPVPFGATPKHLGHEATDPTE
jgi:hypothetical protein